MVLKDNFGEPGEAIVNLTTATSAVFNMRESAGTAVKINRGSAAITNAAGGEITYSWGTADLNTVGDYVSEIEVTWNDGKVETFPNEGYWDVHVNDDLA